MVKNDDEDTDDAQNDGSRPQLFMRQERRIEVELDRVICQLCIIGLYTWMKCNFKAENLGQQTGGPGRG